MSEYFVHESSYVDENVKIGQGTKIWHFSHIQSGAVICGGGYPFRARSRVLFALCFQAY